MVGRCFAHLHRTIASHYTLFCDAVNDRKVVRDGQSVIPRKSMENLALGLPRPGAVRLPASGWRQRVVCFVVVVSGAAGFENLLYSFWTCYFGRRSSFFLFLFFPVWSDHAMRQQAKPMHVDERLTVVQTELVELIDFSNLPHAWSTYDQMAAVAFCGCPGVIDW